MIYYTVTIPFAAVNISATTFIAPWRNGSPYTPFRLGIVSPIERSAIVRAKTAKFFFFLLSFFLFLHSFPSYTLEFGRREGGAKRDNRGVGIGQPLLALVNAGM